MNDEDGDGVMKYSGLWGDLWNGESSEQWCNDAPGAPATPGGAV